MDCGAPVANLQVFPDAGPTWHPGRSAKLGLGPKTIVAAFGGTAPRLLTGGYDADVGGALTGDQRAPRGALDAGPVWSGDGRSIVVRTAEKGRANLQRVDVVTGALTALTTGEQEVVAYSASADGSRG